MREFMSRKTLLILLMASIFILILAVLGLTFMLMHASEPSLSEEIPVTKDSSVKSKADVRGASTDITGRQQRFTIRSSEEILPSRLIRTNTPIATLTKPGVLVSQYSEQIRDDLEMRDFWLEVYMQPDLTYKFRAGWKLTGLSQGSNFFINANITWRDTGKTELKQLGSLFVTDQRADIYFDQNDPRSPPIDADREYLLTLQTCFVQGPCLAYNVSLVTPSLPSINTTCNQLVNNGPKENKLNLVFVHRNYSDEQLGVGMLEDDVDYVLFHSEPNAGEVSARRSFFGIPVLNRSFSAFNVFTVHDEIPCCKTNQLLAVANACGIPKKNAVFVIMVNEKTGTAYAQDRGVGHWIWFPRGGDLVGAGATLAHEFAHLVGVDEEYYFDDQLAYTPREAPNCDYTNLTCEKWCNGVKRDMVQRINTAKSLHDQCLDAVKNRDETSWRDICMQLDFGKTFPQGVGGAASQKELCSKPVSAIEGYECSAGSFDLLEAENIGVDCREGYGCYFGCGGQYQFTRGSLVSIMGAGGMGEFGKFYAQLDARSRVMPDYSKATSETVGHYLLGFR